MKALLVRIGADQSCGGGGWNAPMDPKSKRFVYVPIPEKARTRPGMDRSFLAVKPALENFCRKYGVRPMSDLKYPRDLSDRRMHLDPDFDFLTYGDGGPRAVGLGTLEPGDLVVFYASLQPIGPYKHRLAYALVALYVVDEVELDVSRVPRKRWKENAHTRRLKPGHRDVIVRGRRGVSGRLERCIPIGELRSGAYRVREDVLKAWGGLSVRDGWIQRSAVPPSLLAPARFYKWFLRQNIPLFGGNGWSAS